jgi:hypothetical protein
LGFRIVLGMPQLQDGGLGTFVSLALNIATSNVAESVKTMTLHGLLASAGNINFTATLNVDDCLDQDTLQFKRAPPWTALIRNLTAMQDSLVVEAKIHADAKQDTAETSLKRRRVRTIGVDTQETVCKSNLSQKVCVSTRSSRVSQLHDISQQMKAALQSDQCTEMVGSNFDMLEQVLALRKFEKKTLPNKEPNEGKEQEEEEVSSQNGKKRRSS